MKITDIQAIPLSIPLEESDPASVEGAWTDNHVLVKVFTDEGITGYGEALATAPMTTVAFIEEGLKPRILGENPMHIEKLWHMMYFHSYGYGTKGISTQGISAVEIALWDIIGKYRNIPVYEMIGGLCRDKIKVYASMARYPTPDDLATHALRCVEQGYTAIKLHMREDKGDDTIEYVKAARQAVGPDVTLMVDAHSAWTPRQAVKKTRELEQYDVYWLEEPIWPVDDYDGLAYVRDRSNILIAAGESEYTHYGFKEMISKRAVDLVQPDAIIQGGIMELRKIFALAEAWNLQISTHSYYTGPGMAATIHLSLSNMRSEFVEIRQLPPRESFIQPSLRPVDGYVTVPNKPGLGVEINEDVVGKYTMSKGADYT